MKVKICPLCDSEMKKSHYCDACNSWIWRPEILDIHYNAQQRGLGEEDCAYGTEHDTKDHGANRYGKFSDVFKKNVKSSHEPKSKSSHEEIYGTSAQNNARKHEQRKASGTDAEENKRKAGGCLGKIVLAIIVLNAILGVIGSSVGNWIDDLLDGDLTDRVEDIIDNLGSGDDDLSQEVGDDDYIELSDEDVSNYPDGCDGYGHFEFTDEEAHQLITAWAGTEYGREPNTSSPSEDNYIYRYDESEMVYLQKVVYYSLDENGDDYVMVYSDSVTGKLHSITASMADEEKAKSFYLAMVPALDTAGERSSKEWEMEWKSGFEQFSAGGGSMNVDNLSIYGSRDSDGEVWLMIDPTDF